MIHTPLKPINIALTCSTLLDLADERELFDRIGYESFYANQVMNQHHLYPTGILTDFVRTLMTINIVAESPLFRILLITSNCCETVKRAKNSLDLYELELDDIIPLDGVSPVTALQRNQVDLFLTTDINDAELANEAGIASVHLHRSSAAAH